MKRMFYALLAGAADYAYVALRAACAGVVILCAGIAAMLGSYMLVDAARTNLVHRGLLKEEVRTIYVQSQVKGEAEPVFSNDFDRDAYAMAATAYCEARSEGVAGMLAVAHVVNNRMADAGRSVTEIAYQSRQFSCFDAGRFRLPSPNDPQWLMAQMIARNVLLGRSPDPTAGARFYHTTDCDSRGCELLRTHGVRPATLGRHVFYRAMRPAAEG